MVFFEGMSHISHRTYIPGNTGESFHFYFQGSFVEKEKERGAAEGDFS
ncbi:MAG: hypothetical protein IPL87_00740 [Candidatus Moraniibacteriota bacterium]|nr:MAG: hypothetical protein IPL87_00740 [Candidatus Moranbacteria bacterium]